MIERLAAEVRGGSRKALAKAITLIESERREDGRDAEALLSSLMDASGKSLRIGISGIPGVGKSTLIEALGLDFIARGGRVAVLAVDPSSSASGGSVLADKTRMEKLSVHPQAFVRPSPARGQLGGVARRTRECIVACEAGGYDHILIETVGIGQSESVVASMVDVFVLLQMPHTGDELQTFKKGVLELAHIIAVTKADGITKDAAELAAREYQTSQALRRGTSGHQDVPVLTLSAVTGSGVGTLCEAIITLASKSKLNGMFSSRRATQAGLWWEDEVKGALLDCLFEREDFRKHYESIKSDVMSLKTLPRRGVKLLLQRVLSSR
jgi:LAO/AO transport system kinase